MQLYFKYAQVYVYVVYSDMFSLSMNILIS